MRVLIERALPEQAGQLTDLAHRSKRIWGYPEHYIVDWKDDLTVTREFIRKHFVWVALADEEPIGMYALMDNGERMELEHFWVDPRFMSIGVGRAMIRHAVEQATLQGADAIDISSDPNAEEFYLRMGARRVGRIPAPVAGQERYLPRLVIELAPAVAPIV